MGMIIINGEEYASAPKDGFPPIIYSDEEREIGVWRDGKPLYQKTITIPSSVLQVADNDLPISLPNMETFVRGFGTLKRNNGSGAAIPNSYGSTDWNMGIFNVRPNMFDFWIGSSALAQASVVYITFQYTKTTDTAGSGKYTTYGGITHHYSTSEQVVGTWIDGKPIYEKVINIGHNYDSASGDVRSLNYSITDLHIDTVIKYFGWRVTLKRCLPYITHLVRWSEYLFVTSDVIQLRTGVELGYSDDSYVTIQYTKTTD